MTVTELDMADDCVECILLVLMTIPMVMKCMEENRLHSWLQTLYDAEEI